MKIYDMFQKDIDRQINGVIKVMQTDDENRRQELEEYVITRELRKHCLLYTSPSPRDA